MRHQRMTTEYVTKEEITAKRPFSIMELIIPKGTPVELATNLPNDKLGLPKFWVKSWEGMPDFYATWINGEGLLLRFSEVTPSKS